VWRQCGQHQVGARRRQTRSAGGLRPGKASARGAAAQEEEEQRRLEWSRCTAQAEVVQLGADARQRWNGCGGRCWRDVAARAGADGTQRAGVQVLERGAGLGQASGAASGV
jgi:hypothetical protein